MRVVPVNTIGNFGTEEPEKGEDYGPKGAKIVTSQKQN